MKYYKTDSEVFSEEISRNLCIVVTPDNTPIKYVVGWGTDDNGQSYICLDPEMQLPVYVNKSDFEKILNRIGDELLKIPQAQGRELKQYMSSGRIVLGNLIPPSMEEFTPYFAKPPLIY